MTRWHFGEYVRAAAVGAMLLSVVSGALGASEATQWLMALVGSGFGLTVFAPVLHVDHRPAAMVDADLYGEDRA